MDIKIIDQQLHLTLYGFSGIAVNNTYADTGMKLMDKMWKTIGANGLKHKGINVWVYEADGKMFAGVEMHEVPGSGTGMEVKEVTLKKYVYYKLIGPYSMIPGAYAKMKAYVAEHNIKTCYPWLEIYGHWDPDESKLETEILMCCPL